MKTLVTTILLLLTAATACHAAANQAQNLIQVRGVVSSIEGLDEVTVQVTSIRMHPGPRDITFDKPRPKQVTISSQTAIIRPDRSTVSRDSIKAGTTIEAIGVNEGVGTTLKALTVMILESGNSEWYDPFKPPSPSSDHPPTTASGSTKPPAPTLGPPMKQPVAGKTIQTKHRIQPAIKPQVKPSVPAKAKPAVPVLPVAKPKPAAVPTVKKAVETPIPAAPVVKAKPEPTPVAPVVPVPKPKMAAVPTVKKEIETPIPAAPEVKAKPEPKPVAPVVPVAKPKMAAVPTVKKAVEPAMPVAPAKKPKSKPTIAAKKPAPKRVLTIELAASQPPANRSYSFDTRSGLDQSKQTVASVEKQMKALDARSGFGLSNIHVSSDSRIPVLSYQAGSTSNQRRVDALIIVTADDLNLDSAQAVCRTMSAVSTGQINTPRLLAIRVVPFPTVSKSGQADYAKEAALLKSLAIARYHPRMILDITMGAADDELTLTGNAIMTGNVRKAIDDYSRGRPRSLPALSGRESKKSDKGGTCEMLLKLVSGSRYATIEAAVSVIMQAAASMPGS